MQLRKENHPAGLGCIEAAGWLRDYSRLCSRFRAGSNQTSRSSVPGMTSLRTAAKAGLFCVLVGW